MLNNIATAMRRVSLPELGAIIIAAFGVCVAWFQLKQLNDELRWRNYLELNARYATFYKELPEEVLTASPADFSNSSPTTKRAIRQYFDLYSEEYWLHKEKLIPDPMWTNRINNGVLINLIEYPALISGYRYWKAKGAFQHPDDFQAEVEKLITDACRSHSELQPCKKP